MPRQIIISEQHRIAAVFSEDQIQELVVAKGNLQIGDIYFGIVENVVSGIDAAFVNIGDPDCNGFIHVSDLGPLRLRRAAGAITELLEPQQKVLVQVMKEPTGNKGPRLTGNISLPGRYLVLMPSGRGVNLSRRIHNDNERSRLRALAVLIKPAGMGLVVRTEAEGVEEEAIIEDLELLQKQWETTQQRTSAARPPTLLNRDDDFIQRVLRDVYSADVNRIVTDTHHGLKRVKTQLANWSGGKAPQGIIVDHHRDRIPILEYFRVNAAIREALRPRVDLPSGGYIVIQPTEALTVIDVNSGSLTRLATARETVLWTNCEAATEIARQLRLRHIAGVIVVDFIDMDSRRDQLQVLEHFTKALKADKAKPHIAQLSELGLVELTRKRQGQSIYELFGQSCPTCSGLGHLVNLPGSPEQVIETVPLPGPEVGLAGGKIPVASLEGSRPRSETSSDSTALPKRSEPIRLESVPDLDLTNHPGRHGRSSTTSTNGNRRHRRHDPSTQGNDKLEPALDEPPSEKEEVSTPLAKSSLRPQRSTTEAPNLVKVEMTPEEQEVYALMGISPLIRVNQEAQQPKSALVSVVLPGEGIKGIRQSEQPSVADEVLVQDSERRSGSEPDGSSESEVLTTPFSPGSGSPPRIESSLEDDDGAVTVKGSRRRRRRSSAS